MNKKLLWLLLASLAANVFLGVVVGIHLSRGPKGPPPRPERILDEMADILPAEDARILRAAMEAHRNDFIEPRDEPRRHHEQMRQALVAEPFDVEAFRRATSDFRAKRERMGAHIDDVLIDALPKISPEGRKRLAEFRPPPPK